MRYPFFQKDTPMQNTYHRHDVSDETWELLENHLPARKGTWGGNARDNRQFINAVFWILRTGAPWRDLPPTTATGRMPTGDSAAGEIEEYGKNSLKSLIDEPDFEWLMIDASHVKVHPHAAGARGGNHDMARTKGGSTPRCT